MILDSYVMNFHEFSTVCVSFVEYFPAFQNYVWNRHFFEFPQIPYEIT